MEMSTPKLRPPLWAPKVKKFLRRGRGTSRDFLGEEPGFSGFLREVFRNFLKFSMS